MKVLQIFNSRASWGGEDLSVADTVEILKSKGLAVSVWTRGIGNIDNSLASKCWAFWSGIYSLSAAREARCMAARERPDIVHAHNLYPLMSPSVLRECKQHGIATIWHPHDQRPTCATGLSLYRGATCDRCAEGHDYWCILRNCRGNIFESSAYAIRNAIHRRLRVYQRYAHVTIVWSEFLRQRLLGQGFSSERTLVVPHPVPIPETVANPARGSYVGYLGRLSAEKGINVLLQAAAQTPSIPFCIAGDLSGMNGASVDVPPNVKMIGWIDRASIPGFLAGARFTIVPSVCFETFPTAALEAMSHGIPVIGSRIGGIPEAVQDGKTGLLFEAGNSTELAVRVEKLWEDPGLCGTLGAAGREVAARQYSASAYFESLMQAYKLAMDLAAR